MLRTIYGHPVTDIREIHVVSSKEAKRLQERAREIDAAYKKAGLAPCYFHPDFNQENT